MARRIHPKGQRHNDNSSDEGDFLKDPCRTLTTIVGQRRANQFLTDRAKQMTIWQLWEWTGWNVGQAIRNECQKESTVPSNEINAADIDSFVKALEDMTGGDITYPAGGGACCCCW